MKTFITLLTILLAMVFVVPAFAGEEPYKAAVWKDSAIPDFHISPKEKQFTHYEWDTDYYSGCTDILFAPNSRINSDDCKPFGSAFECPSQCKEYFDPVMVSAINAPEVCCSYPRYKQDQDDSVELQEQFRQWCPDKEEWGKTAMVRANNPGLYEWVIALPKKPEGELNLQIQCGVLKPNSIAIEGWDAINVCAAVTGEQVGPNCTRLSNTYLSQNTLPKLEVIAHPGCLHANTFAPFHLTAYRAPSTYNVLYGGGGRLLNAQGLQVLNGKAEARVALKACMPESVMVKWPVDGEKNALGETETALEAGDLIKVRMIVPPGTVNLYCGKYSVTIGGIGDPETILDADECDCLTDAECLNGVNGW
jgi:hypothetical protein